MLTLKRLVAFSCAFLSLTMQSQAVDGLYNEPPPPDSAFVRVVSVAAANPSSVDLNGVNVSVSPASEVPLYRIVPGGNFSVVTGQTFSPVQLDAQKTYTIVLEQDSLSIIDDTMQPNLTKATIVFYNLTDDDSVGLSTADGGTKIFPSVAPNSSAQIDVNPIAIAFGVTKAGDVVAVSEEVQLERGGVYSVFAAGPNDISVTFGQNDVATE